MALFEKKICDICGGKIGLLGNRKLDDGNMCKECAGLLSPWFSERRRSTMADIKEQLNYREGNKAAVAAFNVTRTLGRGASKVLLDEDNGKFLVTTSQKWRDANPDVLDFAQVTGCNVEIDEMKNEIKRTGADGKQESYNPPRYKYSYTFREIIHVNSPWFDEIAFRINDTAVEWEPTTQQTNFPGGVRGAVVGGILAAVSNVQTGTSGVNSSGKGVEYDECAAIAEEIRTALTQVRQNARDNAVAANAPKASQTCPHCGATTIPDASGRCEFCGGALAHV